MREVTTIGVRIYRTDPEDRHRLDPHQHICDGQTPAPLPSVNPRAGRPGRGPVDFKVTLAAGGEWLVLTRRGHPPQAIRLNEMVAAWLDAAGW